MNAPTITMDRQEARRRLRAYREQLKRRADETYEACAAGYEALAEGTPLLNLDQAIQAGGLFFDGLPKLAVARADRREVRFRWWRTQRRAQFYFGSMHPSAWERETMSLAVDMGRTREEAVGNRGFSDGYALVPMIPADVRPRGQAKDWHILWEVEQWSDRPQTAPAPRDPMLLKHLGGSLYAVLAEWDLTDLERAVLGGAMQ